jgi:hypothetical protein
MSELSRSRWAIIRSGFGTVMSRSRYTTPATCKERSPDSTVGDPSALIQLAVFQFGWRGSCGRRCRGRRGAVDER